MNQFSILVAALLLTIMNGTAQNLVTWDSASRIATRDSLLIKTGNPDDSKDQGRNAVIRANSVTGTPNPANAEINFTYNILPGSSGQIIILQITGAVSTEIPVQGGHGSITMDTHAIKEGLYFYYLLVDGKVFSAKKFVIRH
jgi:hypothetical protein